MKKTIRDFNLNSKKVVIRCDFNVPIKDGKVIDDTRIRESIETIKYSIDNNAKVILMSHLGRIKEESDKEKNTLYPVKEILEKYLNQEVFFIKDITTEESKNIISNLKEKEVCLLENTRYFDYPDKKESKNNEDLAKLFASFGDIFINDAFGTAHRAHASNVGIGSILPNGIGFLIEKELNALEKLNNPERPYVVILGGSKVSDKIGIIENLLTKSDKIIIGGAMAFTFLKSQGYNVGKSLIEEDYIEYCKKLLTENVDKIILPIDVRVAPEFKDVPYKEVNISEINDEDMGLDIGTKTIENIKEILKSAKTVMWNGPLGVYEFNNYKKGTEEIIKVVSNIDAYIVLGGGDITAALSLTGNKDKISHVSTGGGATLEYLEGKNLPGIDIIQNK